MKKVLLLLVLSFSFSFIFAQKNVIDKIVAIVGDEIILQSDIESLFTTTGPGDHLLVT